jgi:hypothetical protein
MYVIVWVVGRSGSGGVVGWGGVVGVARGVMYKGGVG